MGWFLRGMTSHVLAKEPITNRLAVELGIPRRFRR
jgi:hypothetical protein